MCEECGQREAVAYNAHGWKLCLVCIARLLWG